MELFLTPRQLNLRAELYHQLGMMLTAGLTVHKTLEHLEANPPSHALRAPIARLLKNLNEGKTVSEAVCGVDKWLPAFDIALIDAAERSGRLDACFKLMAEYYRERAQIAQQMISEMLYPAFVLHFALFIFAFVGYVAPGGTMAGALTSILIVLAPIYGGLIFLLYACQGRRGLHWRSLLEEIFSRIPILRTARQSLILARLSMALESLINAGVPIVTAWELAATASGSPALDRTVRSWKPRLEAGATFSELVTGSSLFPELFANLYHTGEISGTTDVTLKRLQNLYQTEGQAKMKALSQWTAKGIHIGILLVVAYKIVSWYAGYFAQVSKAIDFK